MNFREVNAFLLLVFSIGIGPPVFGENKFRVLTGGEPFRSALAQYQGTAIPRLPHKGDLKPTVMEDPDGPGLLWKMWWLCHYGSDVGPDLPPLNLDAGDRVCFSESEGPNGPWKDRSGQYVGQVVLKGLGGSTGEDRGDDHLVGSPSVIKVDCSLINCPDGLTSKIYVMFYEAYGNYMTRVNRFYSSHNKDSFITHGEPAGSFADEISGYHFEAYLGYAPYLVKAETDPIYSCQIVYPGGKVNRFLEKGGCTVPGNTTLAEGKPAFWVYRNPGPHRKMLHRCYDPIHSNTFATTNTSCDWVPNAIYEFPLGYISEGFVNGAPIGDMVGSTMNRIHMAYSPDGITWERFDGDGYGNSWAVISPSENGALSPNTHPGCNPWSFYRTYGVGYPGALIRNGYVEIYFQDHTDPFDWKDNTTFYDDKGELWCGITPVTVHQSTRIHLSQLFDTNAWALPANWWSRKMDAYAGNDIKWSPELNRYFVLSAWNLNQSIYFPNLLWSEEGPPVLGSSILSDRNKESKFDNPPPTMWNDSHSWPNLGNRIAGWGTIAGTPEGHVLYITDVPGVPPHFAFHLYYEAAWDTFSAHELDIDHIYIQAEN